MKKHFLMLLFVVICGCASSPKKSVVDVPFVPVPDGFTCEENDGTRSFWTSTDMLASDAMDWYKDGIAGWKVAKSGERSLTLSKSDRKYSLEFSVYTAGGASIEIIKTGGSGVNSGKSGGESKMGRKVKDKSNQAVDEVEDEGLDRVKDAIKEKIVPW